MSEIRRYACINCGQSFEAAQPDDVHRFAMINRPLSGDPIKVIYECENCNRKNPLWWSK